MKTTRRAKTTNTVILTEGDRRVTFTTERGSLTAVMANHLGELSDLGAEEAQERIGHLLAGGWRVQAA